MKRREALRGLAGIAIGGSVIGKAAAAPDPTLLPTVTCANSFAARTGSTVFLDGHELRHCFAANEQEGWADVWAMPCSDPLCSAKHDPTAIGDANFRLYGKVRMRFGLQAGETQSQVRKWVRDLLTYGQIRY